MVSTEVFIGRRMDKDGVFYTIEYYLGMKQWNLTTWNNMARPRVYGCLRRPYKQLRKEEKLKEKEKELAELHVHWVSDAIHLSYPLSSPSLPAFNLSLHQGLLRVSSSH